MDVQKLDQNYLLYSFSNDDHQKLSDWQAQLSVRGIIIKSTLSSLKIGEIMEKAVP